MPVTDILLVIAAGVAVLVGLAGTVLPALPGPILVFGGLLLFAWMDGFARVGAWTLGLLAVMTAAAHGVDLVAGAFGVRRVGASRRAIAGAAFGALLGLFFGLPGLIVGPFVGAVLGELSAGRDLRRAGVAGAAAWLGFVIGVAAKIALVVGMLVIFGAAFLV